MDSRTVCRRRRHLAVWWFLILVSGCAEATNSEEDGQAPTAGGLPLQFVGAIDFGAVRTTEAPVVRKAAIRNRSDRRIAIVRWRVSCGCVSVLPATVNLGAGETREIECRFDPGAEGEAFTGSLLMSIDAEGPGGDLGGFLATANVVAPAAGS